MSLKALKRAEPCVGELIRSIARRFSRAHLAYGHGTGTAREEATWLVLHVLRIPFEALASHAGSLPSAAELRRVEMLARRRIDERIPLAYLLKEAWLGDFRFYVDRRVIVPRSYIAELLVDGIAPFLHRRVRHALDLCTGCGCLAVLLARAFDRAHVDALDLSIGALAVARRNLADHGLERRVVLTRSNLFDALPARRYDLIVSNPPYVNAKAMARLPGEYTSEPRMALAGGEDGLLLVRKILAGARKRLAPRGTLVCEIGHNRRALERAYPEVAFTWLETSAGTGQVFLLDREHLPV